MDPLLDTSLLVREVDPVDPLHSEVRRALRSLQDRGDRLCIVPQNLFELWVVCTRPKSFNGLGLTPDYARHVISRLERAFLLLRDRAEIYDKWLELVSTYGVSGRTAHDVRLVAAMQVHGISSILTYNVRDFARFPHIRVIHPGDVR